MKLCIAALYLWVPSLPSSLAGLQLTFFRASFCIHFSLFDLILNCGLFVPHNILSRKDPSRTLRWTDSDKFTFYSRSRSVGRRLNELLCPSEKSLRLLLNALIFIHVILYRLTINYYRLNYCSLVFDGAKCVRKLLKFSRLPRIFLHFHVNFEMGLH